MTILGDGRDLVNINCVNLSRGLSVLLATYYVLGLNYPPEYSETLTLFAKWVMEEKNLKGLHSRATVVDKYFSDN
jgi:hypothetical protein